MFLEDAIASTPEPFKTTEKNIETKILPNDPLDYQHYYFYKNSNQEVNPFDQCDLKKFIQSPIIGDPDFDYLKQQPPNPTELPHIDIDEETKENKEVPFKYDLHGWIMVLYKISNKTHHYIVKIIHAKSCKKSICKD